MKQIIINSEELQVRVAVVDDGKLQDFFMERKNKDRIVGSIYKGRIKNLEPSLQAAFVDIGVGKNAFLHYWDMIPATQEMLEEGEEDEEALKQRFDAAASAPAAESAVDAEVVQGAAAEGEASAEVPAEAGAPAAEEAVAEEAAESGSVAKGLLPLTGGSSGLIPIRGAAKSAAEEKPAEAAAEPEVPAAE
ncbi:MAG: hypothetical protein J6S21_06740, partial [Victivallales bacterium]|nr:hypothetical protein [Victivallales bacterium]